MKKIKVQMVGSYYVCALEYRLPKYEYIVQNILSGVSPLTLCGPSDKKLIEEWEPKIRDLNQWSEQPSRNLYRKQSKTLFDLKKNFEKFLSRDQNEYCDNVVFSQIGKEVIYRNEADYLIVDNSAFIYRLIKLNDVLYTNCYPSTPFLEHIKSQSDAEIIFPVSKEDFNWRFYFDKYINTILNNYDNSKVILIKTPYSEFFSDKGSLCFSESNKANANFIMELDEYFARKTGCLVIDTFEGKIPSEKRNMTWPFCAAFESFSDEITAKIVGATRDTSINKTYFSIDYNSPIANAIKSKIKTDKCAELINYAEQNRIVTWNKMLQSECGNSLKPFENLLKKDETLFDYIKSFLTSGCDAKSLKNNVNLKLIEDYTAMFNCSLNDILAVYKLYELWESKSDFKNIALNICNQTQNAAIKACDELTQSNIEILKNYEYIDHDILDKIQQTQKKYLHICDKGYLIIDPLSDTPFKLDYEIIKDFVDFTGIIEKGYTCTISYADALTYNCDYYIAKAKHGDGAKPTYLTFENEKDFIESLYYANYSELLKNEKFVFVIGNERAEIPNGYMPVVDFTELLDPKMDVVRITGGLGDQVCHFILGSIISTYTNRKVLFDDTTCIGFNGLEVDKLAKKKLNLLSSKLSKRLGYNASTIFASLFCKISEDYTYITRDYNKYLSLGDNRACILAENNIKNLILNNLNNRYFDLIVRVVIMKQYFDFELSDYIHFPPFTQRKHIELSDKMNTCDAVAIHIRRGDFVSLGLETDTEFYAEAIEKIMKLEQYNNKKFFVFSDDINWCKSNKEVLGLCNVDNAEVIFVEGNKGEESFRDVQLMSLGKIIIAGTSGFARLAMLYSTGCEIFTSPSSINNWGIHPNKYDIGKYKKDYEHNLGVKKPQPSNSTHNKFDHINLHNHPLIDDYITARIDIKNSGSDDNDIIINDISDKSASVQAPEWFKKNGHGHVIQSKRGAINITLRCSKSGTLSISLKGKVIHTKKGERILIGIDYQKLRINNKEIFNDIHTVSHDKPFSFTKKVVDGEIITLYTEWIPYDIRKGLSLS